MNQATARAWQKVVVFYALTLVISGIFMTLDLRAPGNITLISGVM